MNTELSSAKYFSAELAEGLGINSVEDGSHIIADPTEAFATSTESTVDAYASPGPSRPVRRASTGLVTFFAIFLGLAGVLGVFSSAMGALGHTAVVSADNSAFAIPNGGHEAEIYRRTIEKSKQLSTVIYLHHGICLLVGLGFIASCFVLLAGKVEANSFASTACIAAIFYNCLTFVVTFISMPSFEGLSGLPEGFASTAFAAAIGVTGFFIFLKICFYVFMVVYFSKPSIKAIYAPAEAELPEVALA